MDEIATNLKPVFDACDENGDGFVKTEDLIRYSGGGQDHSNEEIQTIIDKLDPDRVGRITFDEFCQRYQDALGGNNGDIDAVDGRKLPSQEFDPLDDSCFEGDSTYSTASTNDYNGDDDDTFHDEVDGSSFQRNQKQYSTFPPPTEPRRTKKHHTTPKLFVENSHSDTSEYQSEEGYEGYGESFSEDSTLEGSGTLKGSMTERGFHKSFSSSSLSHRRVSANKAALLSSNPAYRSYSANTSRRNSMEDIFYEDRPMSDTEAGASSFLYNEIRRLSSQVSVLTEDHKMQLNKRDRFKDDKWDLSMRINGLEEQLEQQKISSTQNVIDESKRYKSALSKIERDNEENLLEVKEKLRKAEGEIQNLKVVEPMLRKELESCQEQKRQFARQVDDLENELHKKETEIDALKSQLDETVRAAEEDRHHHEKEMTAATEQIVSLEKFKADADVKLSQVADLEQKAADLEKLVQQLTKENSSLKNTKDDALLVQLSQNGQYRMHEETKSLADELITANKDKVIDALREQEEESRRLRGYLDSLLMIIMEHNPALLEIT